ncbi:hypothetical protein F4821DRAFT_76382 [Hypoxylon rubiginosum]|uniref:Uncharacterized protein n=1 Tax=Hypoxylon rubiginosum TaxID=110542 RepID=A0ACC0DKP0_9PEZI|nr:hypothetical protein F4821DRAFT_76382 [Hypoxylon rubiginosum]
MAPKTAFVSVLFGTFNAVSAFWRMECHGRTGVARIDPIMDVGVIAPHVHVVHGSSGFSESATFDDLAGGSCTSCAVKQDMSAYWTPGVYFQDGDTGEFEIVRQVGGMLSYYLLRGENVTAFPPGFQMVSGSNYRRDYTLGDPKSPDPPQSDWAALKQTSQADLEQRAIGFNCLDYSKAPEPSLYRHYMPDKAWQDANCPDGLRIELAFPSCWNGEPTAEDHKSHMAYPDLVQDGTCPDTHPHRLVTLFYETIWNTTEQGKFLGRNGQFVISNGDPTGFGYHGDFMSGWDQDFLQEAIDTCTNESGDIRDCALFVDQGPLQDDEKQTSCLFDVPSALANENVLANNLQNLPGNIQIQTGPESATPAGTNVASAIVSAATSMLGDIFGGATTSTSSTLSTSSSSSTPLATSTSASLVSALGGAFLESATPSSAAATSPDFNVLASEAPSTSSSTISSSSPAAPTTTPAPVVASEPGVVYQIVSTQTITNGAQVQEIVWKEPVVYVTEDSVTTVTVPGANAGRKLRPRHAHQHGHHRRSF